MSDVERYRRVSAAIGDLYSAAADDTAWIGALRSVAGVFDAGAAFIRIMNGDARDRFAATWGYSEVDLAEYQRSYAHEDYWAIDGLAKAVPGIPMTGDQLAPREKMERASIYHDFFPRYDMSDCLAMPLAVRGADLSCLVVNGRGEEGRFRESHRELARLLLPHLQQTLLIRRRLGGPKDQLLGARLAALGVGLALFTRDGGLVWSTPTFERLAAASGVFRAGGRAAFAERSPAVAAVIARTLATGAGGSLAVRTERGNAVVIRCALLPPHSWLEHLIQTEGLMITLELAVNGESDRTIDAAAEIWGLSRRERDFLHAAASQRSIAKAARAMGVMRETARTHAKRVYLKAGVHSFDEMLTAAAAVPLARD